MRLDTACDPVFARHETFHPRFGWVKKGLDAAMRDPHVFNDESAVIELGVGKNMVRSIRFWGLAYKVLAPEKRDGSRIPLSVPSVIGRMMFADDGWDPYGEFAGTEWLLHWWLLAAKSRAPVWWLAFNEFPGVEFRDEQLEVFIADRVQDWAASPSAIKKDVACLLRMYSGGGATRAGYDEMIDCPPRDLRLISTTAQRGTYRFTIGNKPTLPPAVVAFACLDFVARTNSSARTVSISRLAIEPGSPGSTFKLTEAALVDLLERAAAGYEEIDLTSAAGAPQLTFGDSAEVAGSELLFNYYKRLAPKARVLQGALLCGPKGSEPYSSALRLEMDGVSP